MADLQGRSILIIENEIGPFVVELQRLLEASGAETLVARNPAVAFQHTQEMSFTAALICSDFRYAADAFDAPTLVYGANALPREPSQILSALSALVGVSKLPGLGGAWRPACSVLCDE